MDRGWLPSSLERSSSTYLPEEESCWFLGEIADVESRAKLEPVLSLTRSENHRSNYIFPNE